ncbi:DENN domain-containing protein 10-like [Ornithodoros turicata]|uniref:UDENN domain-containing protein n=1 Tax=Ornithodoros turicata TaxID=34597 RepID=A0A2R5LL87_9ACAR
MAAFNDLRAIGLIEKDTSNDVLWTWSYPSFSADDRSLLLLKCDLENDSITSEQPVWFRYCHHHGEWFYMHQTEVFDSDNLSRVRLFVLILRTKDLNPEKYETLARILSKVYCKMGDPTALLRLFLSVSIKGSCTTEENGTFLLKDFERKRDVVQVHIKEIIRMFGLETILIYTALILKKRVMVYHHKLSLLLKYIRVFPALTQHRTGCEHFFPFMELNQGELAELSGRSHYLVGFRDAAAEGRLDLYDLFVNLAAIEITVAPHCKDSFQMSKTHKEIAMFMVRQADNENVSDQDLIRDIATKTQELLSNLKRATSCSQNGRQVVSLQKLKELKFAPALENFYWNLAVAEGLVDV